MREVRFVLAVLASALAGLAGCGAPPADIDLFVSYDVLYGRLSRDGCPPPEFGGPGGLWVVKMDACHFPEMERRIKDKYRFGSQPRPLSSAPLNFQLACAPAAPNPNPQLCREMEPVWWRGMAYSPETLGNPLGLPPERLACAPPATADRLDCTMTVTVLLGCRENNKITQRGCVRARLRVAIAFARTQSPTLAPPEIWRPIQVEFLDVPAP